jgi:hypothetical protein
VLQNGVALAPFFEAFTARRQLSLLQSRAWRKEPAVLVTNACAQSANARGRTFIVANGRHFERQESLSLGSQLYLYEDLALALPTAGCKVHQ